MTTVAVTGAGGFLAGALLERLDADRSVEHIVGIDSVEPPMPVAKLTFRTCDIRDPLLPVALDGVDVVVHLALTPGPDPAEDKMFAVNVHGTRNLLRAAQKAGVRRIVHVSSGTVYGAHPGNVVPLDEGAPLRANPDFNWAYHHLLAEELVAAWAAENPDATVAVLRPVTTLGPGVGNFVAHHLELPRLPVVRGYSPPLQLLHVDDLAAAIHLAIGRGLSGAYNVAPHGWLALHDLAHLIGKRVLELPETVAFSAARRLWRWQLIETPPGALHYLMHPWVLSNELLRDEGWSPTRSNRDVLREFVAEHHGYVSLGRLRLRRRNVYGAVASLTLGTTGAVAVALLRLRRRRRRSAGIGGNGCG